MRTASSGVIRLDSAWPECQIPPSEQPSDRRFPPLPSARFERLASCARAGRGLHMAALCAVDQGDGGAAERLLGQVSLRYVDAAQVRLEWARQHSKGHVAGPKTAERVEEILQPLLSGEVRA